MEVYLAFKRPRTFIDVIEGQTEKIDNCRMNCPCCRHKRQLVICNFPGFKDAMHQRLFATAEGGKRPLLKFASELKEAGTTGGYNILRNTDNKALEKYDFDYFTLQLISVGILKCEVCNPML